LSSVILSTTGEIDGYTINDLTPINGQVLGLGLPDGAAADNDRLMFVSAGPADMIVDTPPEDMQVAA